MNDFSAERHETTGLMLEEGTSSSADGAGRVATLDSGLRTQKNGGKAWPPLAPCTAATGCVDQIERRSFLEKRETDFA